MPIGFINESNPFTGTSTATARFSPMDTVNVQTSISSDTQNALEERIFGRAQGKHQQNMGTWEYLGKLGFTAGADLLDTIWSSPVMPGDRGDLMSQLPMEDQEFYSDNQMTVEGVSAIVGTLATGIAAEALIAGKVTQGLAASTAVTGSRAWKAASAWNKGSLIRMQRAQQIAARTGASFGLADKAYRAYITNRAVAGAAVALRSEPIVYTAMWSNDAFNSHDWATEGFWTGVGATVGASFGIASARRVMRQTANSDYIRNLRAAPKNMAGVSNDLTSVQHLNRLANGNINDLQVKESANFTEFALASRSQTPGGYDQAPKIQSELHVLRDEFDSLATNSLQKILTKGTSGVPTINAALSKLPEAEFIMKTAVKEDPFVFHGLAEAGIVHAEHSVDDVMNMRKAHLKNLEEQRKLAIKNKKPNEAQRLANDIRVLSKQEASFMVNGSWVNHESKFAKAVAAHDPGALKSRISKSGKTEAILGATSTGDELVLDAALNPMKSGKRINPSQMSYEERFMLNEMAVKLTKGMGSKNAKVGHRITGKPNWFQLDLAAEIMEKGGKVEVDPALQGKLKLNSPEEIRFEALKLKARELLDEVGTTGHIGVEERFRYNLPMPHAIERLEDASGDGMKKWLEMVLDPAATPKDAALGLDAMRATVGADILMDAKGNLSRIDGQMLSFNRDSKGNWMRPILGFFDNASEIKKITENGFREAMAIRRANTASILTADSSHVGELSRTLVQMPETRRAMNVTGLADDQITGLDTKIGQAAGELLPNRHLWRDNDVVLAASKIQEATNARGTQIFSEIMEQTKLTEISEQLAQTTNASSRALLDEYFSLRSGWDIEDVTSIGDGKYGFLLSDTPNNRKLLDIDLDSKWQPVLMKNERLNKPIVVDELGMQFIESFNAASAKIMQGDNVLRTAKGMTPVAPKSYYVPPQNTIGKRVGFMFGPDDQVVPGWAIVADSDAEFERLMRANLDEINELHGAGHTIRTKEALESLKDIWDEAAMDWLDPGLSSATAGISSQKRGLVGARTRPGAAAEAIDWLRRKSQVQAQDTLKTIMQEPLLVARAQGVSERAVRGANKHKPTRTIFDSYEKALTGKSVNYSESSILNKALSGIEASIDNTKIMGVMNVPGRWVADIARRTGFDQTKIGSRKFTSYKQIVKELGPHSPYKDAMEFVESQGIKPPPSVAKAASKMNEYTTAVMLRYLELPHAALNLVSMISTMPATVIGGRAPVSTFIKNGNRSIPIYDSMKIMADAMKDMTHRSKHKDWNLMLKNGDASQSALDYHKALSPVNSMESHAKWLKDIDKWISIATDTSENMSRQYAHFVGLRMADAQGIIGDQARHDFAREVANAAISDYAPINRPELFESGLGSMVGLFQSYMLNHMTKMFRWMETGNFKAMGIQAGLQASMFGLNGTYGLGQLFDLRDMVATDSGDPTFVDLIYQRFGPVLGGAISTGSLGQLTQISMWSRGDTSPRIPTLSPMSSAPMTVGLNMAKETWALVGDMYYSILDDSGEVTAQAFLEHAQRIMPNRVLKGWLILANEGREIDARGNVMSENQTILDNIARTVGLRSTRQQQELDAYYTGKAAMERDAVRMERVRNRFRRALRSGEEVSPVKYFNDYVDAGGNPRRFKTWLKNIIRDADSPRAAKTLRSKLQTQKSALELWRYGAYGAWRVGDH